MTDETGDGKDTLTGTTPPASGIDTATDSKKHPTNPSKQDKRLHPKPTPSGPKSGEPAKPKVEPRADEPQRTMREVAEGFQKVISQYCYPRATVPETTATFRFIIDTSSGTITSINIDDKTGGLFELCVKSVDKLKQQLSFASVSPRYLLMSSYQLDYKFTSK